MMMTFDTGTGFLALLLLVCLQQRITMGMTVPQNHPMVKAVTDHKEENKTVTATATNEFKTESGFFNPYAESSIFAPNHPTDSSNPEENSLFVGFKPPLKKRDVEQEADSANGKAPIPFYYKKQFFHPNARKFLTAPIQNKKDYSGLTGYPPFTWGGTGYSKSGPGVRYQRQRRSFQSESIPFESLQRLQMQDELLPSLDYNRERFEKDSFLRLMALLASQEAKILTNYNLLNNHDDLSQMKGSENDGDFQDDELEVPIDLGYYGQDPYQLSLPLVEYENSDGNVGTPLDLARMGVHLSEVPGAHGLYISPQANLQMEKGLDADDEWLEDVVPLQSHFKQRRSDNTLFRHNPVKSHFRRYQRSPWSSTDMLRNERFGPFYPQGQPIFRQRRSSDSF